MYTYQEANGIYSIYLNSKPVKTPMASLVTCNSKDFAEKFVTDLNGYGADPSDPASLTSFHYAMLDFFRKMPFEELQYSVAIGLNRNSDWTFDCPSADPEQMMQWWSVFGRADTQIPKGLEWLASLKRHQLCAVTIIGRALESVNIPFIVATAIQAKNIKKYAKEVHCYFPYVDQKTLVKYFENYSYYFNLEQDPA